MSRLIKFGLVFGGYVFACLAACGVVYVYQLLTQVPAQSAGGMYAFSDLILFIGVFGVLVLFPTGLGHCFLFKKFLA